jgi:type IV secretion system protein VirB5
MFRRPSQHYGKSPVPVTPYQRAAQVWDDRIGSARVQARSWRLAFFGCLALSGGLASALVWQSLRGLARFIEHVRSIPADPVVLRKDWLSAYDFTTPKGAQALNDHARANDPFAEVGKMQVAVDVSSVIRASRDSFRIAWTERRYQDGSLVETSRWSAILTTSIQPPRTPDALRRNPLGVFVTAISWSKELSQ